MADQNQENISGFKRMMSILGPGLLYAGAAIGVSHLVQSTRAGAGFGLWMILIVVLANIIKYPFFEFGPRYAAATGESLIEGYRKQGKWALWLFIAMTIATMFTIQAAVTVVTAGLAEEITGKVMEPWQWSGALLLICLIILGVGQYKTLDKVMKFIIVLLSVTTIVALAAAFAKPIEKTEPEVIFSFSNEAHVLFLVALIGWMPAPIDISIWHSVWSLAKKEDSGVTASLKESLLDFKIGYWGTTILAAAFVSLGALVLYRSGNELPDSGGAFAKTLINIYTSSLGTWAYVIIALAAFTTMFSTTLTCLDAFPRVLSRATFQVWDRWKDRKDLNTQFYWIWIIITAGGAVFLLSFLMDNMREMVDLATTLSFLTAPVLALVNYLVVTGKHMPEQMKPGKGLRIMAVLGLIFLFGFSLYYLYFKFLAS